MSGSKKKHSGDDIGTRAPSDWARIGPYALVSLIAFLLAAGLLFLLVFRAQSLTQFTLIGHVFYVLLVVLGLCAAAFLFGVLKSVGELRGRYLGWQLELGGPIVACALVVWGGFQLAPSAPPLALTIFVHGPAGLQDTVLRNSGNVILDLGSDRRREHIGDKGEATFPQVPAAFRGRAVPVSVDAPYEAVPKTLTLDSETVYLEVRHKSGTIAGLVQNEGESPRPVEGAILLIGGLRAVSGPDGQFQFTIPGDLWRPELNLSVSASGFAPAHQTVVPDSNPVTVVLKKARN
jgi:hypothetical protein